MKHCHSCRHWRLTNAQGWRARAGWGWCAQMEMADGHPLVANTRAMGCDGVAVMASVETAAIFSCSMWSAR